MFSSVILAPANAAPDKINIQAQRITSFSLHSANKKHFGSFEFIGGLQLNSSYAHFGALSGLRIKESTLTAVTDTGFWFQGHIERNDLGAPIAIKKARMNPILNVDGQPFANKWQSDFEGLTFINETAYLSTEMDSRLVRSIPQALSFDLLTAPTARLTAPFIDSPFPPSMSFEAIATLPPHHPQKGALLVLSEGHPGDGAHIRGFIYKHGVMEKLSVLRRGRFVITDADFLPNGDLLILERRYSIAKGAQMRLRKVKGSTIKAGAILDGPIVLSADRTHQIDNMEGLTVFQDNQGHTRIGLISDNNHWLLQRNLYLEFKLSQDL